MNKRFFQLRAVCAVLIIGSVLSGAMPVKAQDLMTTSDITNGTSIFIFRQASNRQTKLSVKTFAQRPQYYRLAARQKMIARRNLSAKNKINLSRTNKISLNTTAKNKTPLKKLRSIRRRKK